MRAYYNERDPFAAQWLRNLISAGHITPGEVDTRSITEVSADDLRGFTECHFFAGIGVWSHALRRAGWSDDVPVWTGSCPCQPFSAAGKQKGFDDERHLWPVWFDLIRQCRPAIVLGEQVASALDWLDLVSSDMESAGYAFGASDLCAAGFGGAHIRQRLYFVAMADADNARSQGRRRVPQRAGERLAGTSGMAGGLDNTAGARRIGPFGGPESDPRYEARLCVSGEGCGDGGLADADQQGSGGRRVCDPGKGDSKSAGASLERSAGLCADGGLADADGGQSGQAGALQPGGEHGQQPQDDGALSARSTHPPLLGRDAADWLYCRDGKWRPVEPGTFPLVDAAPARVGRLRAYGNALDAETAAQFCGAVSEMLAA